MNRDVIGPGEGATIEVAFTAPERPGVFDHAVFFKTNDRERRTVALRLFGRAVWPVEAVPANLYLGIVRLGEIATAQFELASASDKPVAITALEPSTSTLTIEQIKESALARTYRLTFRASRAGRIEETIRIATDHPKRPTLTVGISGEVVTSSGIEPKSLLLGMQRPGAVVAPRLEVHSTAQVAVESVSLRASGGGWSLPGWNAQESQGKPVGLTIRLKVPTATGYHRNALLIKAKTEAEPFEIPVSCLVSAD